MDLIKKIVDFVLHVDVYLSEIISRYGSWTYALLFFVALSLDDLPKQTWLEWGLLAFLFLLLVNNGLFLRLMAGNLSPYFPALGG